MTALAELHSISATQRVPYVLRQPRAPSWTLLLPVADCMFAWNLAWWSRVDPFLLVLTVSPAYQKWLSEIWATQ